MDAEKNLKQDREAVLDYQRRFPENIPFMETLGAEIQGIGPNELRLSLVVSRRHLNLHGTLHGGVMMALLDSAMGGACYLAKKSVVSLSSGSEFIRGVPDGHRITAIGRIIHNGRRIITAEGEVRDADDGRLCLTGHATFYVIGDYGES